MSRLVLATTAVEVPMGAQAYQSAVVSRARAALQARSGDWRVEHSIFRSLRSALPGTDRLPMGYLQHATPAARRAIGRTVFPRRAVVHRMDLLLPPHPGHDVVTLHDVVAWRFADESEPVRAAASELARAAAVICVSEFTAQEASDLLGVRETVVIPNGVDQRFFTAAALDAALRAKWSVPERYALYAGGSAERKNLRSLAAAWAKVAPLRPDLHLVLAGPTSPARVALFTGTPRVVHVGRLPDEVMPGLMAGAVAAVVPSLYEGFGLPALEAMAAGTPLVAARTSSLPEVVGDTATLVDPTPDGIAQGLEWATSSDSAITELASAATQRAAGYSWERSAAAHAAVWAEVAG